MKALFLWIFLTPVFLSATSNNLSFNLSCCKRAKPASFEKMNAAPIKYLKDTLEVKQETQDFPEELNKDEVFFEIDFDEAEEKSLPPVKFEGNRIHEVSLRIEETEYYYLRDELTYNNENYLFFRVTANRPSAEVRVFPEKEGRPVPGLRLLPSSDFEITDTLVFVNEEHYRGRIRFRDLTEASNPGLIFRYKEADGRVVNREIKLFPYFITRLHYDGRTFELFQGEEKTIEIPGSNLFNLYTESGWQDSENLEYRMSRSGNNLRISVKANATGRQTLRIPLQTIRPFVNIDGSLTFQKEPLELEFNVKPSRLPFVNTDKDYIFFDPDRRGEEIRLDYHTGFRAGHTYRIENRQESGGRLIAELYIKSFTTDNRVVAEVTTYDRHRTSDGYLYIKDGTHTRFMTNFNIVNRPEISNIEILRPGQDWTTSQNVRPGEKVEVKLEGEGLLDVDIRFDGCIQKQDSVRMSDRALFFEVEVPKDISRNRVMIFKNREATQHELLVREFQRPAAFDFIKINYGTRDIPLTDEVFSKPVFYDQTIKDINIIFDPDKIDQPERFYGKQYLTIEVRVLDDNNKLLDLQTINNVVVCPGESSPRFAFYGEDDCRQQTIRLNEHLLRNTYMLDAFSQIIITVKHNENRYNSPGNSRKVTIFSERKTSFDIMVSFPAGLLVKEFSQPGIGNLSGISTSVLAEISFYDPNRIGAKRPFKFGAGFIALNAFNFSESENIRRDIGVVGIAAIEPVRTSAKFSVPIYFGVGYLLKESDMFAIFGPGIRLQF